MLETRFNVVRPCVRHRVVAVRRPRDYLPLQDRGAPAMQAEGPIVRAGRVDGGLGDRGEISARLLGSRCHLTCWT
jgi:hypothetical protein